MYATLVVRIATDSIIIILPDILNGMITKIDILKHYHGPGFGADEITEEVIKKQTLEVDAVTGATKSSFVLKKAIENALEQGL